MKLSRRGSELVEVLGVLLLGGHIAHAIQLDLSSTDSIKAAASTVASGMMKYYHGNDPGQTPGLLVQPYYWWEAGAMFGQMIEYWFYTGDSQWNEVVTEGLLAQVGPNNNYMPPNQTKTEGNDDQAFWAFATMSAAELNFPNPPPNQPSWLSLSEAVFNLQAERWDTSSCGGGLRWQIYNFNRGYDYKNSISNGGFFQLAARLARYTSNGTYAEWADKTWDWFASTPLLSRDWQINDGSATAKNCTDASQLQWTYNYGTFLMGAANMYNYTNADPKWRTRIEGILNGTGVFFPRENGGNVMVEVACEAKQTCDNDQPSFKAYLSRWMAATTQLAPFTADLIMTKLRASAQGAAAQCSGGTDGVTCGRRWTQPNWDEKYGVGEQMSALSVIQANLISKVVAPVTTDTGGTSKTKPSASDQSLPRAIQTSDKVGASIVTALLLVSLLVTGWWIC
ncbi:MAG: hydrolase 76 protein [Pleopsidium flavum]|nr:MAG: hydrolase 76 protein [Pleopsidium flavum]